jgi:hypothetical protein
MDVNYAEKVLAQTQAEVVTAAAAKALLGGVR